jgi:hypothetical protein
VKPLQTVVAVQLPSAGDLDVRAFGQAVAYPEIACAVVGYETDHEKRTTHVRLAASAIDPTSLSLRAAELVRTLLDRFYVHRQHLADAPAHT